MSLFYFVTSSFFSHYNNHIANNFLGKESATETVDLGSIPGVKPKSIKIGIHSFLNWRSALKGIVWSFYRVWSTRVSCKRADKFRPEPEILSPNPKTNLKP